MSLLNELMLSWLMLGADVAAPFGAMHEKIIAAGLKSHDRVLHIKLGANNPAYAQPGPDEAQQFVPQIMT